MPVKVKMFTSRQTKVTVRVKKPQWQQFLAY